MWAKAASGPSSRLAGSLPDPVVGEAAARAVTSSARLTLRVS